MLLVENLLSADEVAKVRELLASVAASPGADTAGYAGRLIKDNLQYDPEEPNYKSADAIVRRAMFNNGTYQAWAFPYRMTQVRFSRYDVGMRYGEHLDAALMPQPNMVVRADLSFTVFLTPPDEYDGGELVVKVAGLEKRVKPNAGDMFVYPSGNYHRVETVTRGCREAGVGWVQSLHASEKRRRILHNVHTVMTEILTKDGKSRHFELLNDACVTLERLWSKP